MLTAEQRVCAVVVTHHPADTVTENLASIRPQVRELVVVDNGSANEALRELRDASARLDVRLIEAGENLGIAAAQNLGVRWAESQGFDFVTFFDQDSVVPEGFVEKLVSFYETGPNTSSIAVVVPRYRDQRFGHVMTPRRGADGDLKIAMSSGSLIPVVVLRAIGLFEEALFIDFVDYEFCLRARRAGYVLRECVNAELSHAPADPRRYKFLWLIPITSANYSPFRRYYLARNLVWMLRRYGLIFPRECLRFVVNFIKDNVKIVLVESGSWEKARASLRGLADGLRGRMGRAGTVRGSATLKNTERLN